jgi:hypothetical protein
MCDCGFCIAPCHDSMTRTAAAGMNRCSIVAVQADPFVNDRRFYTQSCSAVGVLEDALQLGWGGVDTNACV